MCFGVPFFASLGLVPFPSNGKLTQVESAGVGSFLRWAGIIAILSTLLLAFLFLEWAPGMVDGG